MSVSCESFNDAVLPQINEYIATVSKKLILNRNAEIYDIIKARYTVKQRVECRENLFNYVHTEMLKGLAKLYEFNTNDRVQLLFNLKPKRFGWKVIVIRDFKMSRGIIIDLDKSQTRVDIMHTRLVEPLADANNDYPMPRLVVNEDAKPCVKYVPPVVNKFIVALRSLKSRKEFFVALFFICLLMLYPILYNMYHFIFKPVELSWYEKIFYEISKILNKLFPLK